MVTRFPVRDPADGRASGHFDRGVLALGLGIGANTAIFSVVKTVLLDRLPVRDPATLVRLVHHNGKRNIDNWATPYADVSEWRRNLRRFTAIAAQQQITGALTGGEPERVVVSKVNAGFFPMIGVYPRLGRNFAEEEDHPGAAGVALLSHELFLRRFGGQWKSADGARLFVDELPYRVIGVLPSRFRFDGPGRADLYVPLALAETSGTRPVAVSVFGRLKPGVTQQEVGVELDSMTALTIAQHPAYRGWHLQITPVTAEWISPDVRTSLWVLAGAVGLVLLIGCANVAGVLLSRAAARRREIAVRAALGAARSRLVAQLLTESTPMGLCGGALGLFLAWWGVRLLPRIDISRLPRVAEAQVDGTALAFTVAISLLTCLLFGLAPALTLARGQVHDALKESGRASGRGVRGRRLHAVLVVVEVALALVLSVGASLMVGTFYNLSAVNPGFNPAGLLSASLELPRGKFSSKEQLVGFYDRVVERARAIPGVKSVALTSSLPLGGSYFKGSFPFEGHQYASTAEYPVINLRTVDGEYVRTLQIPLARGRFFDDAQDRLNAPPVVAINETTARQQFAGQEPIGKHIAGGLTVIGVIRDMKHTDVAWAPNRTVAAVPPNAGGGDDPGGARGSTRVCGSDAGGSPATTRGGGGGQKRAAVPRGSDGEGHGRAAGAAASQHDPSEPVRHAGIVSGGAGHLRRVVVRRGAAHARNRRAGGARRGRAGCGWHGGATDSGAGQCRVSNRRRDGDSAGAPG